MIDLTGKIALVTGASRGIGAAIAHHLAHLGATVYGTATTPAGAEKITQQLSSKQGTGVILDVTDTTQVQVMIDEIIRQKGKLDIVVNNAGITKDQLTLRMKEDDWNAVIQTNLSAVFQVSKAAIKVMMKQRYGRIVSITSIVGAAGNPGQANYAAAKAGVAGMTRALAQEVASRGITINCVAPGFIQTDMTQALSPEQAQTLQNKIPLGVLGTPEDVAYAVAFLVSDQAKYITGEQLHVNGGLYMS